MKRLESNSTIPFQRTRSINFLTQLSRLRWLLIFIPLLYMALLLIYPMSDFFRLSFYNENGFTLEYFTHIFTQSAYLNVIGITLRIAIIVTLVSLLLGYPVAYLLVKVESRRWKNIILFAVLIPFWISLLVRTFAWMILLQDNGVINTLLMNIGVIDEPLSLLYNTSSVVVGMVHVLLPFMILSLYPIMEGIDDRLVIAAQSMGASPLKAFFQVFLPLSLPGILAGSMLVFVQGIGYFVTPALLGGRGDTMLSLLIRDNIETTLNWNIASALAVVMFVIMLIILLLTAFLLRKNPVIKGAI